MSNYIWLWPRKSEDKPVELNLDTAKRVGSGPRPPYMTRLGGRDVRVLERKLYQTASGKWLLVDDISGMEHRYWYHEITEKEAKAWCLDHGFDAPPETECEPAPLCIKDGSAGNESNRATEQGEVKSLAPCQQKTYGQYLDALRRNPELANSTDRDVYAAVEESLDTGEALPTLATWTKYLRVARKYHNAPKHERRAGREHGKSIVQRDQI